MISKQLDSIQTFSDLHRYIEQEKAKISLIEEACILLAVILNLLLVPIMNHLWSQHYLIIKLGVVLIVFVVSLIGGKYCADFCALRLIRRLETQVIEPFIRNQPKKKFYFVTPENFSTIRDKFSHLKNLADVSVYYYDGEEKPENLKVLLKEETPIRGSLTTVNTDKKLPYFTAVLLKDKLTDKYEVGLYDVTLYQ